MGVKIAGWQEDLVENLAIKGIAAEQDFLNGIFLVKFKDSGQLVLHLISIGTTMQPEEALEMQQDYLRKSIQLVHLWEDVWQTRPLQVLSRISSMLGKNRTIHGRKTKIVTISKKDSEQFFDQYHLQSCVKARYHYALKVDEQIIAVASFSAKRNMTRKAEGYTSIELIRFATADGITVQGGLSKLIRHMIKTLQPNDVMTYADRDWSYGKGYTTLGFELAAETPPAVLWLNRQNMTRYFPHRLPQEVQQAISCFNPAEAASHLASLDYYRIFNTGNLKYILYL